VLNRAVSEKVARDLLIDPPGESSMTLNEFLQLTPGVMTLVTIMFWPVIWGAALMARALAGDVFRQKTSKPLTSHRVAA
jgi:hypothetical protein